MACELRPGSPPRGEPEQNDDDQQNGDHQYAQNNGQQEAVQNGQQNEPAEEQQQQNPLPQADELPQLENADAEPDVIARVVEELLLIVLREVAIHELLMEVAVGDDRFVIHFGNAPPPRVNGENGLFHNGQVLEGVEMANADVQNEQPPHVDDEVLGGDDDGDIFEPNVEIVEFVDFGNEVRDQGYDGDLEDNV